MIQKVVGMFESNPQMQRIIKCGLLGIEYNDELDVDDYNSWTHGHNSFHGYSANDGGLSGKRMTSSSSGYQPPLHYYTSLRVSPYLTSEKVQAKESDTERKARLLQEAKKSKEKAEKKRLKKQKQKQRKQMEKEKQNPVKNKEGKDDAEQSKPEESKPVDDQKKDSTYSSGKLGAAAKDTDSDSSEQESGDEDDTRNDSSDSEELDMTSTFVSKAALIAKRKLEQKTRAEKKEKKKIPEKEQHKSFHDQTSEDQEVAKEAQKDSVASSSSSIEDNVKISTDLAILGNKFASVGDYNMAVKYFTDAIKYNPTEFKLFGNRSFCFEKLHEYDKALTDAELSLGICPGWVKGLFRKGRALAGLKRYEDAAQAFRDVLKLDSSYAEAAQELMRVQIIQLMEFGFTREQSSNALIIHGTVNKALQVLSKLNYRPGAVVNGSLPAAQVANVTGVSPVLSANTSSALIGPAQSHSAPQKPLLSKPLGPALNIPNVQSQSKPIHNQFLKNNNGNNQQPPALFPVWVGNLIYPVTDATITNLFSKAGAVYSVKVLQYKRCAFVNFTKQEHCDEAIRRFHGYELNGNTIVVRYPDRIPPGMGISKSALKADDLQDENQRQHVDGRNAAGSRRPFRPFKPVPEPRGNH
ncbi:tetratricopeptide repeat protein 31-like isoform X2 [Melanotaenia boesemani]|nr:tetratricopeptide repeat protein 31-like isoform X2 [Melanotaenia boesemani]